MSNMKKGIEKTEYVRIAIFAVIVFLQMCVLVYCFAVKKKDYHSDELFSYGLANSYYQPFISSGDHAGTELINNNEWLSGEIINDYLSVQKEHRFAYDSVYYNNSKDVHPPFYYMVLHTICSFFPEIFTKWFGFGLNLVLFFLSQVLIYQIVSKITKSSALALAAVLLYGFNQGGIDTYIFIRMYAMCAFFLLLCLYLHVRLYYEEEKKSKLVILLALTTFFGGLTHYYYLIAAGVISACFCVWYLTKKQYRFLMLYAIIMLAAAGMVIAAYPFVLTQLLRFEGNHDIASNSYGGFGFEWRALISFMLSELSGINISIMPTYFWIHLMEVLLAAVVVLVPVCFLLRKEMWFKNAVLWLKDKAKRLVKGGVRINVLYASMILCTAVIMIVAAATVPVYKMGTAATRYLFPIYPVIMILFVLLLNYMTGVVWRLVLFLNGKRGLETEIDIKIKRALTMAVILICLLVNHLYTRINYYFDYENERLIQNFVQLDELPRDADYIFVLREFWILNCLTASFRDIPNFFATDVEALFYLENELNGLSSKNPVYLVMEIPSWKDMAETDEEELKLDKEFQDKMQTAGDVESERTKEILKQYETFFRNLGICDCFTYIGNSAVYGREVFIFQIKS